MELEIDRIFGLPAHPLFAHAPVVLIPLTAIAATVCAFSGKWRERVGWVVVGLALLSVAFVQLAIGSGEALEDAVKETELVEDHAGVADTLLPISAGMLVAVTALVGVDRAAQRRNGGRGRAKAAGTGRAVAVLAAATVVTSTLSGVWVYRTGHSGAKAVWDDPDRPMLDTEARDRR